MAQLTVNEQIYMISIWHLKSDAYGVRIREKINELSGKTMAFGTIYNNLDQLVKKGYVVTKKGETTPNRGGNIRVYYRLTDLGKLSLHESRSLHESLWFNIPKNAFI